MATVLPGTTAVANADNGVNVGINGVQRRESSTVVDASSVYSSDILSKPPAAVDTTERLAALRQLMAEYDLCCYIVPSEDAHQSEYVAAADQRRAFISGFDGSAGVACITRNPMASDNNEANGNGNGNGSSAGKAILNTDGRYFNQAMQQLDSNWSLLRMGVDKVTWRDWCVDECVQISRALGGQEVKIGIDPNLVSFKVVTAINKLIEEKVRKAAASPEGGNPRVSLVPIQRNLIDEIWGKFEHVPERIQNELLLLDYKYHGEVFMSKRDRVVQELHKLNDDKPGFTFIAVALDEIAWLLNLRGSDIEYNPVFNAYLLLNDSNETVLFTNDPFNTEISNYFDINRIQVRPYAQIWSYLNEYAARDSNKDTTFFIPDTASWQLERSVSEFSHRTIHSPIDVFKSVKNDVELSNARVAQVKDGVCLAKYFSWLEDRLIRQEGLIDEYKAAEKLIEIRQQQPGYKGNSFETISSTGANAAVIHYSPPKHGSALIDPSKVYLCDSGSQFLEGTTDITRTIHFTQPTQEEINCYTLVLKGNLALARVVFPDNIAGYAIDCLARQYLWAEGLDYRHGTGHGIGAFLNVHEGPIGIGGRPSQVTYPLQPGNIVSNEPGYYKDGDFGIRIEDDMVVREVPGYQFGPRRFLKLENITMVPYCRKLINLSMLSEEEKYQINVYHKKVWDAISKELEDDSLAYEWLRRETAPFKLSRAFL